MSEHKKPTDYTILTARCSICNKVVLSIYPKQFETFKKQHEIKHPDQNVTWQ